MSWVKLDDQLHAHPKVAQAWAACEASIGLHMLAMSYCGCFGNDGEVTPVFVAGKIPAAGKRRKAVAALVSAGLWDVTESGWKIHDWAIYNGDAESREAARIVKVEAGRRGGQAKARNAKAASEALAPASEVLPSETVAPYPYPYPTAFHGSSLSSQGCSGSLAFGDPGPEEPSNVIEFPDGKTDGIRGVA